MTPTGGVVVAALGQHSRQTALALQERGLLRRYVTGYHHDERGVFAAIVRALPRRLGARMQRQLQRRHHDGISAELISSSGLGDVVDFAGSKFLVPAHGLAVFRWKVDRFNRIVARVVQRLRPSIVVCFDTTALPAFAAARSVNAICVLDQTIGHVTQLVEQFRAAGLEHDMPPQLVSDSITEARTADFIVTSSRYVVEGLVRIGVSEERIIVIPYGVDLERFHPPERRELGANVRALYVGHISKRKGVPYLFDAFQRVDLPQLSLTALGRTVDAIPLPPAQSGRFQHIPAVPHSEVHEYYRQSDFFVQVSLHESSALTVFEALASGLPVITTPNSGSVVRDGIDGFIVPPRDVELLASRMRLLTENHDLRREMSRRARERVESFSWAQYRERIGSLFEDLLAAGDSWPRELAKHRQRMTDVLEMQEYRGTQRSVGAAAGTEE